MKDDGDDRHTTRIRFPIGVKLAIIIGTIVLVSLGAVSLLNSYFQTQDVRITAENNNLTINSRSASSAQDKLLSIRSAAVQLLLLKQTLGGSQSSPMFMRTVDLFFTNNADIAAVYEFGEGRNGQPVSLAQLENSPFFAENEVEADAARQFLDANGDAVLRSLGGETIALNASPFFGIPAMALLVPLEGSQDTRSCAMLFSMESLSDIMGTGTTNITFMINDSDDVLVHPETDRVLLGENMHNHPLVSEIRASNSNDESARQIPYTDTEDGVKAQYYGAYQTIQVADITVITIVPLDSVLEGVRTTTRNNLYLTLAILFLSIIAILTFTRFAISRHLRKLTEATSEIQKGNFNTDLIQSLNNRRMDEIGVLNKSTQDEQEFLNTFAKFTNVSVAKAIATKTVDFSPHLKDCTIFFSDIRSFTQISNDFKEKYGDESAARIIEFLNDYMSRMVNCVTLSGGNIDKFEGDAIMGVWGLLRHGELAYERLSDSDERKEQMRAAHLRNVEHDAIDCLKGICAMRYALMEYNRAAEKDGAKPRLRIGCGINTGRVTAGVMGGGQKMEYTAIGDAVNLASRTESASKQCGADILITEDTYNLIKDDYVRTEQNGFTLRAENEADEVVVEQIPVTISVKGKGELHFYAVVNMPGFDIEAFFRQGDENFVLNESSARAIGKQGPKTMQEVRALLGIPQPDFEKVDLNAEENKTVVKQ